MTGPLSSSHIGQGARLVRAWTEPATRDLGWEDRAVCLRGDPEAFWPEKGESPDAALVLCAQCPVLGDCREAFYSQGRDRAGGPGDGPSGNTLDHDAPSTRPRVRSADRLPRRPGIGPAGRGAATLVRPSGVRGAGHPAG